MKRFSDHTYRVLRFLAHGLLRFVHPIARYRGKENVPEGAAVVVCNHSAFTDPVWVQIAMKTKRLPLTMAKKELTKNKLFWAFCHKVGAFPVDRDGSDIQAIKTSLQCLRDDNKLLIFPEGTRVRHGKTATAHNGAMMIACRAKVPILPVYLTAKKSIFSAIDVVIGAPYMPLYEGAKPTSQELDRLTQQMMDQIYAMGETR
ncbi:MAG: 1-acyl-sn-glycerol-3-phosphate acyltransferase [Ruminococcaceae bacterium]|nr:1-acyl-sn-glycerol-3-phosphate acyltransferase [Oscillospiraceae bacterium]